MSIKFFLIFIWLLLILNISFISSAKGFSVGVEVVAGEETNIVKLGRDLAEGVGNLMSFRGGSSIFLLPILAVVLILILLIIVFFKKKKRFKKKRKRKIRKEKKRQRKEREI